MKRPGFFAITICALLFLFAPRQTAAQQVTVNVSLNGQAAAGLSVVFVAANTIKTSTINPPTESERSALNLGNLLKTRTTVTDSSGSSILDLSNIIKPHGQTEVQIVVRVCKDGKNVVYIVQKGATIPPQDQKCVDNKDCECKDRPVAGIFLIGDGDHITVGITPETVEVHVTHTGVSGGNVTKKPAEQNPLVNVQLGGGAGFKRFSGINTCVAIITVYSSCSAGQNAFNFQLEGNVNFGKYLSAVTGFNVTTSITRKASDSSGNTEQSTVQTMFEPVAARITLPLNRFQIFVQGGGAIYEIKLNETQTFSNGTSTTTVKTPSIQSNGFGPLYGAGVGYSVTPKLVIRAQWNQFTAHDGNRLDEHNNVVVVGLYYRIP